jgi:glycosyltransferase involved in cell wall biosynthesis
MKTKNILIICPFFRPNIGGVESHLDLLTKYLVKHNFKTTVLTYKPLTIRTKNYKKIEKSKNLIIYRFWWFGNKIFDKTTPYPILQFIYIVPVLLFNTFIYLSKNHQKIDTIHAHGFAAGFIVSFCSLFFKIKRKVISTHYIYPNLNTKKISTKILKWTFNKFDKIFLVGNKSGEQLQKIGLDKSKMVNYKHWLDSKIYKPKMMNKDNNKIIILFVGRIIKMKGIFILLEVAKKMPPNIIFNLIGNGPDFELLKNKSANLKNFNLLGKKNPNEIIPFYQKSDFTVLPSISPEAQPMVVMESLMCGTPVITTNKGSVSEMYIKSVGIAIDPNINNLYRTILNFYQQPDKIKQMKVNSRNFALKNFSEKNAFNIVKYY